MQIYKNEEFGKVRCITIDDVVWFVGKDVAKALEYTDTGQNVRKHVDDEDKLTRQIDASGEYQRMPYLDNRFYGVDGEIVIAGRAGSVDRDGKLDNGKYYCELGKMILPFPIED